MRFLAVATVLGAALIAFTALRLGEPVMAAGPPAAVTPVAPGNPPCVGMPQIVGFPEEPALAISNLVATPGPGEGEATLTWASPPPSSGLLCIALYRKGADGTYPSFVEVFPFLGSSISVRPTSTGAPVTACYRLVAIAKDRRGPASEVCVTVTATPPPVTDFGIPPPPEDLRLAVTVNVTNPDGSFVPIAERKFVAHLTWITNAAVGAFEIRRGVFTQPGVTPAFELVANVPANAAPPGGTISFDDPVERPALKTCYRVRLAAFGDYGREEEACSEAAPSSGPGLAATPTPLAPEAGNSIAPARSTNHGWWLAVAVLGAAALAGVVAPRRQRR